MEDYTISSDALSLLWAQLEYFEKLIIERALKESENSQIKSHNITNAVLSIMEDIAKGQN